MVPSGWKKGLVSDLADTVMGYAFKSSDFVKEGIPLVRMGNLYQNQFQLDRSPIYLPDDFATEYKRFLLQSGDLVMSMTGTMGKRDYGFAVEIPENTQDCLLNQRVLKIEPRNSDAKGFVLNVLKSEIFLSKLYSLPGGTKQANLSATQIREISVLIPPLPEQQKIAKILSTWDKAISTTERLIENGTQQKKSLMQQLLTGKKRLLDESGKRFEGEWKQVIFGEVAKLSSKKYNPLKANQCLPCIELEYLDQGSGRIIGSANASELASMKNHFEAGSVLFGKLRPYLRKYARPDFEGVCSTEIWVFKTTSKLLDEYLFHFVQTDKFVSEANKSSGSKMPRADWGVVSELVIKIPNLKEQQKIATVLTTADKEIELLERQLADLQHEKKALMQVLLTGKKRVVV